jgi:endonuclease/exonuclease/phosphatase family metal-dependent hydrolase
MHALNLLAATVVLGLASCGTSTSTSNAPPPHIRVATYNIALNDDLAGGVIARLQADDPVARRLAAVIQRVRPDVLLLNEIDFDAEGRAGQLFRERYLAVGQFGEAPIEYRYHFSAEVNTGVPSGLDLTGDGRSDGPGDAWGFGAHPGQYGMLVLSRFPIDAADARTFQKLRWAELPNARGPLDPDSGEPWYAPEIWAQLRLSSKSHWDLPIDTPLGRIHLLAAHPTPPAFDGPERRNVVRNADEIRLWAEYLNGADWMVDDQGRRGGLAADARFVIVGDLNADPKEGSSQPGAIQVLLNHPRVQSGQAPVSKGSEDASLTFLPDNGAELADATDTANFGDRIGNLRVDYALPSRGLTVLANGVFWPKRGEPGSDWVSASDHRMVWMDLGAGTAD